MDTVPIKTRASESLGLWEPKRTLTLDAARRHTARIKLLRRALIAASIGLVGLVIYHFASQGTIVIVEDNPTESVKIANPRYSGRTEDGLPFYITAETATRTLDNRTQVSLKNPVLEFIRADGAESSFVEARSGTYDDIKKVLKLATDVTLDTDDGYNCRTTKAEIYARDKRIEGNAPIECSGRFGQASGTTYAIEDDYSVFVFDNGMKAVIEQDPNAEVPSDSFGFSGKGGVINVTAAKAVYDGADTTLTGDVVVVQSGAEIKSQTMMLEREISAPTSGGSLKLGDVSKITATKQFRYRTAENDVMGDRGVYERQKNLITVTGDVRVRQPGGNMVSTDRLVYNTRSETVRFSGNCQGRDCGETGRTRTVIGGNP